MSTGLNDIFLLGIDPASNEKVRKTSLSNFIQTINSSNPPGAQGLTGANGTDGVQGFQGSNGTSGNQGAVGAQGFQGTQGAVGFQGNSTPGAQGNQGNQGSQGSVGNQGNQGASPTGAQGSGAQGAAGAAGLGVDLYLDLSDTPATFADNDQALVVNSAGNAVTHTSLRTRIASSNSTNLNADNTAILCSSAGTVGGKYSSIICSKTNNVCDGNRSSIISSSNSRIGSGVDRALVTASDNCRIYTNDVSIMGSENSTVFSGGNRSFILQSQYCFASGNNSSIINSNLCDISGPEFSSIHASDNSNTYYDFSSIMSSQGCDTRAKYSCIMSSVSCDTITGGYSTILGSRSSNCQAGSSAVMASRNCTIFGTTLENNVIVGSYTCSTSGSRQFIGGSKSSNMNTSNGSELCILGCNGCNIISNLVGNSIFASQNSSISGVASYSNITASNNCFNNSPFSRIIASKNSSHTSSANNYNNLIMACDNCDVDDNPSRQVSFIASTDTQMDPITGLVSNSVAIATDNCRLNDTMSQGAILACSNVTNSGDNSAIIGCNGATYNNTSSYTVRVRQVRAYTFTKVSDRRMKKDIEDYQPDKTVLNKISQIPLNRFRLKSDTDQHQMKHGFIAQEVLKVIPEMVIDSKLNYREIHRKVEDSSIWYYQNHSEAIPESILSSGKIQIDSENKLRAILTIDKECEYLTIDTNYLNATVLEALLVLTQELKEKEEHYKELSQKIRNLV